jgi:excisionase family DNA binding protein
VSCLSRTFLISNSRKPTVAHSVLCAERPTTDFGAASPRVRLVGSPGSVRPKVMPSAARIRLQPMQTARSLASRGMKRKTPSPTLFTERSLAAHLAVSDRTIRNWIRRGELPSYKLGASRRIDPADIEDFLARHRDEAA